MIVVRRAQRFPIVTRVFWRARGQVAWSEGLSVNVSCTGLLFQPRNALDAGTELEFVLELSRDGSMALDAADVRCFGSVARVDGSGAPDRRQALAITIDYYSFVRQPCLHRRLTS